MQKLMEHCRTRSCNGDLAIAESLLDHTKSMKKNQIEERLRVINAIWKRDKWILSYIVASSRSRISREIRKANKWEVKTCLILLFSIPIKLSNTFFKKIVIVNSSNMPADNIFYAFRLRLRFSWIIWSWAFYWELTDSYFPFFASEYNGRYAGSFVTLLLPLIILLMLYILLTPGRGLVVRKMGWRKPS